MAKRKRQNFEKIIAGTPKSRDAAFAVRGEVENIKDVVVIRKTPVCWGIPMDEVCYSKFWTQFMRASNIMPWDGIITTESTYLPDARNTIHENYVKSSDIPYLMMVDSDVLISPGIVDRLMKYNLPIIGGWYHNKKEGNPVVYDYVSDDNYRARKTPGSGVERVDGMGAGCWLMKREVAVALGERPYDMENGGEDLRLCSKLRELGIPLHVDWGLPLAHVGVFFV